MPIDKDYQWLKTVGTLPKMVSEAIELLGTAEIVGPKNNPTIIAWSKEVGGDAVITSDETAWCGLFMAVVARRAGKTPPPKPLWALNWAKFGVDGGQPELGDVLTFIRKTATGTGGHVGLYIGEDAECYHVLGGNQGNRVCFTRIDKDRLRACRQPPYMVKPASARPYLLKSDGNKSTNEQ